MPRLKTREEVIDAFKIRELSIINIEEYKGKDSLLDCYDKKGYFYRISLSNVTDNRTKNLKIVGKNNPYSIQNIQNYININNGTSKIISKEYKSVGEKLEFVCECGNKFKMPWYQLINCKKFICNDCALLIRADKRATDKEEIEKIVNDLNYKLISLKTQRNLVVEDIEGYKYKTTRYSLQIKRYGKDKFAKDNPFTVYNMCNYLKLNNIPSKLFDETERTIEVANDYIEFICPECNEVYKALWGEVAYIYEGKPHRLRCSRCSKSESNLEYVVRSYLENIKINFTKQKRFDNCRNIYPLPFDFYLDDYNCAIEVNGSQHYYENEMFVQTLEERQRLDKIKKDYCKDNNVLYLEIPFWDIENNRYKNAINNILNQK